MAAKELTAEQVGLPRHEVPERLPESAGVFDLTSHRRARDALEFGLCVTEPRFNIFVIGEERSGRMTATLAFLEEAVTARKPPADWIYLNNFREPHRPRPYVLPPGVGRRFAERMAALIPQLREALSQAFSGEAYETELRAAGEKVQREIAKAFEAIRAEARTHGLDLAQTPQGVTVVPVGPDGKPVEVDSIPEERRGDLEAAAKAISEKLRDMDREATQRKIELGTWIHDFSRQVAENATGGFLDAVIGEFQQYPGLAHWLVELRVDVLENIARFRPRAAQAAEAVIAMAELPEQRYAVNLLVDRSRVERPEDVLEPNPTVENLFGRIEYRQVGGVLETDFTLIRPGALHRANGGILVLRAESLAARPQVWELLKGALRDQEVRIEELHRAGGIPIAGAPKPVAIPLDVKVAIVGAPKWYYAFFSVDPEFRSYFKIKADMDSEMAATPENLATLTALIRQSVERNWRLDCEPGAMQRLLGQAARWAGDRGKLSARIELLEDTLSEAAQLLPKKQTKVMTELAVRNALENRRRRNARVEDRLHESIAEGTVMIDTGGAVRGQVNALTVRDLGDHAFGTPARVTARASVGRSGVINIERDIAMSGPIQQKGVMVLQGFLAGHFAQRFPLSFNCSITFEQSYGGVEGDSASMAELIAVVSDIAGLPVRQDVAITGSVNQRGQSQAVGGVHHKVEGFFRTCMDAGGLSGTQGVVVPAANEPNLVLNDEVSAAIAEGRFHVWSVASVDQAIELLLGVPAGDADAAGAYPPETVYGKVAARLEEFDRVLAEREG